VDRRRALKGAGKLWSGESSMRRNPENAQVAEWKRSSVDVDDGTMVNYTKTKHDPFLVYGLYGLAAIGVYLLWKKQQVPS